MSQEIITIRPDLEVETLQKLPNYVGVSEKTAGAKHISMNMVLIPPGASAEPHRHRGFETAIYLLQGKVETHYGEKLEKVVVNQPGDFIYIPADLPHKAFNPSAKETAIGIVARNDANEQESVELVEISDAS